MQMKFSDRPLIDTTIDMRYFVEEQLGEHPAGMLYQARHLVLRQPMALVVIHRRLTEDRNLVKEFKGEVAEAARVTSPQRRPPSPNRSTTPQCTPGTCRPMLA